MEFPVRCFSSMTSIVLSSVQGIFAPLRSLEAACNSSIFQSKFPNFRLTRSLEMLPSCCLLKKRHLRDDSGVFRICPTTVDDERPELAGLGWNASHSRSAEVVNSVSCSRCARGWDFCSERGLLASREQMSHMFTTTWEPIDDACLNTLCRMCGKFKFKCHFQDSHPSPFFSSFFAHFPSVHLWQGHVPTISSQVLQIQLPVLWRKHGDHPLLIPQCMRMLGFALERDGNRL